MYNTLQPDSTKGQLCHWFWHSHNHNHSSQNHLLKGQLCHWFWHSHNHNHSSQIHFLKGQSAIDFDTAAITIIHLKIIFWLNPLIEKEGTKTGAHSKKNKRHTPHNIPHYLEAPAAVAQVARCLLRHVDAGGLAAVVEVHLDPQRQLLQQGLVLVGLHQVLAKLLTQHTA